VRARDFAGAVGIDEINQREIRTPAGAESLDLLNSGSEQFYLWGPGQPASGPFGIQVRVWKSAGTALIDGCQGALGSARRVFLDRRGGSGPEGC
jgi:hypothetical protein